MTRIELSSQDFLSPLRVIAKRIQKQHPKVPKDAISFYQINERTKRENMAGYLRRRKSLKGVRPAEDDHDIA